MHKEILNAGDYIAEDRILKLTRADGSVAYILFGFDHGD
jgi:hypothetical protein